MIAATGMMMRLIGLPSERDQNISETSTPTMSPRIRPCFTAGCISLDLPSDGGLGGLDHLVHFLNVLICDLLQFVFQILDLIL